MTAENQIIENKEPCRDEYLEGARDFTNARGGKNRAEYIESWERGIQKIRDARKSIEADKPE